MPKYLIQASYTAEGLKGLAKVKATGRKVAVSKMFEKAGAKIEAFYFSFGKEDVLLIVDAPDNVTVAALSIAASSGGFVRTRTTPLLTVEEVDKAFGKKIEYLGPGQ